jgi:hypothetical protein
VEGDTASGTVKFEVPDLYAGQVAFEALRSDGEWTITQFKLPAYDVHISLNDRGLWEVHKETP